MALDFSSCTPYPRFHIFQCGPERISAHLFYYPTDFFCSFFFVTRNFSMGLQFDRSTGVDEGGITIQ